MFVTRKNNFKNKQNALLAFSKIRKYEENGIYQGDSLIWTFETGRHVLNTKDLRKMIISLKEKLGY